MRLELRKRLLPDHTQCYNELLLIAETKEESKIIDVVMGSAVDEDGHIAACEGKVQLSDGYADHYILLNRHPTILRNAFSGEKVGVMT